MEQFDEQYWNVLNHIKLKSKEKGITITDFVKKEIKRLSPLAKNNEDKNDFFKRITSGAGPRD